MSTTTNAIDTATASRVRAKFVTGWSERTAVRLVYNGTDRKYRKPSISPNSCDTLRCLPEGTLIEFDISVKGRDVARITGEARRNSHYFFMRKTRLPDGWPDVPNGTDYELSFRVIGYDDPTGPKKLLRLPECSDGEGE
jgi:hypothetical protein